MVPAALELVHPHGFAHSRGRRLRSNCGQTVIKLCSILQALAADSCGQIVIILWSTCGRLRGLSRSHARSSRGAASAHALEYSRSPNSTRARIASAAHPRPRSQHRSELLRTPPLVRCVAAGAQGETGFVESESWTNLQYSRSYILPRCAGSVSQDRRIGQGTGNSDSQNVIRHACDSDGRIRRRTRARSAAGSAACRDTWRRSRPHRRCGCGRLLRDGG